MPNIVVNTCELTPNFDALEAVAKHMLTNRKKEYLYSREIAVLSGRILIVNERHIKQDDFSCDCSFQVTKKKQES